MIGINSYRKYRYETVKIGWTLATLIVNREDKGPYRPITINELYAADGEQQMYATFNMNPEDIPQGRARNVLERNLAFIHKGRDLKEVRYFQLEIEEVCRKTLTEIYAMEKASEFRIVAEEVGVDEVLWSGWLNGKSSLPETIVDCLVIASEFNNRDGFLEAFGRSLYLFGTHAEFARITNKNGRKKMLGERH